MRLLRSPLFFRLYRFAPHALLGRITAALMQARHPRWAVQWLIRKWIRDKEIDLSDFEETEYACVEDFFLRRLKPGKRPLQDGLIAPVDGRLMAYGPIQDDTILQVKGQPISVPALINGQGHNLALAPYIDGHYITIFLTPNGYHRLHMPCDARIERIQWLPGRAFPQNEDAVHHIPRIYERNERAVLACRTQTHPFLMVLVGASLIGGIHLTDRPRHAWALPHAVVWDKAYQKGDEFGHFSFGSTIILLFPPHIYDEPPQATGSFLRMGETLLP